MLEIKVLVASAADAQQAASLFQRLADDMSARTRETVPYSDVGAAPAGAVGDANPHVLDVAGRSLADSTVFHEGTSAPRRGRPRKPPAQDPVDAYTQAGGTLPPDEPSVEEVALANAEAAAEPETVVPPENGDTRTRDELIAALRTVGTEKGALWFRDLLTREKAGKLSEMSDDALRRGLAGA